MQDKDLNKIFEENSIEDKRKNVIKNIFDMLPKDKQDWVIVISVIALVIIWIADLFILDPLPFVDEIILPILAYLVAQWYANRKSNSKE